jgi:hypothetical protein
VGRPERRIPRPFFGIYTGYSSVFVCLHRGAKVLPSAWSIAVTFYLLDQFKSSSVWLIVRLLSITCNASMLSWAVHQFPMTYFRGGEREKKKDRKTADQHTGTLRLAIGDEACPVSSATEAM